MKKLIIFDFDGTIIDTMTITYQAYIRLAKEEDLPIFSKDDIESMRGIHFRKRLKEQNVSIFKMYRMMKRFIQIYKEYIPEIKLFAGMKDLLVDLSNEDVTLAIVSSNQDAYIKEILKRYDITIFKDNIFGKASIFGKSKNLKKAIRKNQIKIEDSIYIGDELRDIEACRKIGLDVAVVSWGYDTKELLEEGKPDFLVDDVDSLRSVLNRS